MPRLALIPFQDERVPLGDLRVPMRTLGVPLHVERVCERDLSVLLKDGRVPKHTPPIIKPRLR